MALKIAILALQGAFARHAQMITSLEANALLAKKPSDLENVDGLIIPGGESTTMLKQIDFIRLMPALEDFVQHKPIFGTCAGLILMSRKIIGFPDMRSLKVLDVSTERNAFGRQTESFSTELKVSLPNIGIINCPGIFIRAPKIKEVGSKVSVLASYENEPVLVQQGMHLACSFHPELTDDSRIHAYFLSLVKKFKNHHS
jgi:5'-phosphate synthase pdxT subunit